MHILVKDRLDILGDAVVECEGIQLHPAVLSEPFFKQILDRKKAVGGQGSPWICHLDHDSDQFVHFHAGGGNTITAIFPDRIKANDFVGRCVNHCETRSLYGFAGTMIVDSAQLPLVGDSFPEASSYIMVEWNDNPILSGSHI